jgi:hypothetical protein
MPGESAELRSSHVRIQGLSAGHHQYDGAEDKATAESMTVKECQSMVRRAHEDFRMAADVKCSEAGQWSANRNLSTHYKKAPLLE